MRDFYSNLAGVLALVPAVYTADQNGPAINLLDASGVVIQLVTGAIVGAGEFGARLQESADGATWADVPEKWVQTNAPLILAANSSYRIGYTGKLQYIRLVLDHWDGTSIAAAAVASIRPLSRPVA